MPERKKDKEEKSALEKLEDLFLELLPEMLKNYEGQWVVFGVGEKEPLGGYWHCEDDAKKIAYLRFGPKDDSFIVRPVSREYLPVELKSQVLVQAGTTSL